MRKYFRLAVALIRSVRRSYVVWQMNEASRDGYELYSCASCGMARTEPCEHWKNLMDRGEECETEEAK